MTPEHKAAIAEGKRKAKEARAAAMIDDYGDHEAIAIARKEPEWRARTVEVVYRPFDGDPHTVTWNKIEFRANIPVTLNRGIRNHWIEQLQPKRFVTPDGEVRTKHVETMMFMGDCARGNPSFEVDGYKEERVVVKEKLPPAGFEWGGTNRDDFVPNEEVNWPADFDPNADAVYI